MDQIFIDLLTSLEEKRPKVDKKRFADVYSFALVHHIGQLRHSGEDYITHPVSVAKILIGWGLDQTTVEAALLHALPKVSSVSLEEITALFGQEVASLVAGVNRVASIKLRGSHDREFLDNLRRMFISMARDIRVILIRLADRLDNISTLEAIPISGQKRIANETLEIYAPLAEHLGMGKLKGELEDLSFPYIYPEDYRWLLNVAKPHFKFSQFNVSRIIKKLHQQLAKNNLTAKVEGRPKRKYSLFKKLLRPEIDRDISKIYDLIAIRIITKDTASCYAALGVVHQYWKPVPNMGLSDFIAQPKPNGYQSIHTKVFDHKGNIVEIQIRSEEMHLVAELGAAAHFAYAEAKNNGASGEALQKGTAFAVGKKMNWVKQLAGWQKQLDRQDSNFRDFKLDALSHHIYLFSPQGDVYDLPEDSTPVDFAFSVHSDLGLYLHSAKVNGQIVSLNHKLKSGDIVEIQKSKTAKKWSKDWLRFVKTSKAKSEIRRTLPETIS